MAETPPAPAPAAPNPEPAPQRAASTPQQRRLFRLREEKRALEARLAELERDRDGWKGKAEAIPAELAAARGELRAHRHAQAFAAALDAPELAPLKAVPAADLMTLLGYAPAADQPDPEAIKAGLLGLREAKPYLFAGPAPAPAGDRLPAADPGPAAGGRGVADRAGATFVVTQRDLVEMSGRPEEYQKQFLAAQAAGTLVVKP